MSEDLTLNEGVYAGHTGPWAQEVPEDTKIYELYGSAPSCDPDRDRTVATDEERASWAALRATGDPLE